MSSPNGTDATALLAEVDQARNRRVDAGRPDAVKRQHSQGKMTARERIDILLDEGTDLEYGALVTPNDGGRLDADDLPADGLVVVSGLIDGRPAVVVSIDFTVYGGSVGMTGARKLIRAADLCQRRGIPFVTLIDGSGHRIQEMDGREFGSGGPSPFREQALMSGWTPQVSAVMGPAFAGFAAVAALADYVPIVRPTGSIGVAGPAFVKSATGEDLSLTELGGADIQCRNGAADDGFDDDKACLDSVRRFLSYLPTNAGNPAPVIDSSDSRHRTAPELRDVVPTNPRQAYDVRAVITGLLDHGEFMELRASFAPNLVTVFGRLDGQPVGVIANQPKALAGTLDGPACEKASRFVSLCDAFGLPIVSLIDTPGLLVGRAAESQNVIRRAGKLLMVLGHVTVPVVSVVLRKAYGLAYSAMAGGRSYDAAGAFLWPTAAVSPMGIDAAVELGYHREIERADDPDVRRSELISEHYELASPMRAASGFGVDDVIDPACTRTHLIKVLRLNPGRTFRDSEKRHWIEPS